MSSPSGWGAVGGRCYLGGLSPPTQLVPRGGQSMVYAVAVVVQVQAAAGLGHGGGRPASGGHRLPGCACRRVQQIPTARTQWRKLPVNRARCRGHGVTYTALDFSRLSSARLENLRRELVCVSCGARAFFRHRSRDGRAACFGSNDHRRACPMPPTGFSVDLGRRGAVERRWTSSASTWALFRRRPLGRVRPLSRLTVRGRVGER